MADAPPDADKPKPAPLSVNDGLGCLTVIVVFLVSAAVASMFSSGAGDGWKVAAAAVLGILGLGVVWVCARYRS
jgi:hypothetical protein